MASGIMELDRLVVGFVELYGKAWHNHPNCQHKDGAVTVDEVRNAFDYLVEKVALGIPGTDVLVPGASALIRRNGDQVVILYPAVGDRYEVIQNAELLSWLEAGILEPYQVSLESAGTLLNGQKAFVNIILDEHTVPGDNSKTITRLMYSNSFGGDSLQGCVHSTRIVCQNTMRIAVAQGAANETLRKFRHTKNASLKIEEHIVDLAKLVATNREHYEKLDMLAGRPMTVEEVKAYMNALVPVPEEEGRGKTRRQNQQEAILKIFEEKEDLQGKIARTRYAMVQAVIDWSDHDSSVRNGDDEGGRFWDGIWGIKDKFKQTALELIAA